MGWVYDLQYFTQKSVCIILDFIIEIYRKLVGLESVKIDGKEQDLLSYFMLSKGVTTAFYGVLLVGVVMLTIFTVITLFKSETADAQHKKTKGQILSKSGQAFLIFVAIPFLLLAGILLTNAVMLAVDQSMKIAIGDGSIHTKIGGQILVTSGGEAYCGSESQRAKIEQQFINGVLDYNNLDVVKTYYDLSKMNFFIGIGGSLVILIMFAISVILFVQRLFDIVLLYIISPISTATIPIDDGGRFRIWKEMLISKILGAYGIVLSMNIFFLIVPQINKINFFDNSFQNGVVAVLVIIGGSFTITKANMVVAQLTGNNAGTQESQQLMSTMHTGFRMGRTLVAGATAVTGRIFGGSDYIRNKRSGAGFFENVASTVKTKRNQHEASEKKQEQSRVRKGVTTVTRLATMPLGMLKDLSQGGLVAVGKNFIPRIKNIAKGTSIANRAEVKPKSVPNTINSKEEKHEADSKEHKG